MVYGSVLLSLEFVEYDFHGRGAEDGFIKPPEEHSQPSLKHILWHRCLELAVADENDNRVNPCMIHIQKFGQAFRVSVILMKRVLKVIFPAVNHLAPLIITLISEDPAGVGFRLDDDDPVNGNQNMINLGRAVLRGDDNVVNAPVNILVEMNPHPEYKSLFADPSFERPDHF